MADPSERRLRLELRSRAYDLLAEVPHALPAPVEYLAEDPEGGPNECLIVLRLKGWRAPASPGPPPGAARPEGVQLPLPGVGLTWLERGLVEALLAGGNLRMTTHQLRESVEARLGRKVGESALKTTLARLTDGDVEVLDNDRAARPPGYRLTRRYLDHLDALRAPGDAAAGGAA